MATNKKPCKSGKSRNSAGRCVLNKNVHKVAKRKSPKRSMKAKSKTKTPSRRSKSKSRSRRSKSKSKSRRSKSKSKSRRSITRSKNMKKPCPTGKTHNPKTGRCVTHAYLRKLELAKLPARTNVCGHCGKHAPSRLRCGHGMCSDCLHTHYSAKFGRKNLRMKTIACPVCDRRVLPQIMRTPSRTPSWVKRRRS